MNDPHRAQARREAVLLRAQVSGLWAPPQQMTVSQWAASFRQLSPEASEEHGQWYNERTPYLVEPMDAFNDPLVERIDIMAASQLGKTEILLNILGYIIDRQPGPVLCIEPDLDMARTLSKDRIVPMVRDTAVLHGKVAEEKSRSSNSTILHKSFPGGMLTIVGAHSAAGLSSRPIRYILADECDRYPLSAGKEGSPLDLAIKRTTRFRGRKIVSISSPANKGNSIIEQAYQEGTQEQYCFACPECGEFQPPAWNQVDFEHVGLACRACGCISSPWQWYRQAPRWIAAYPERRLARKRRSFKLPMTLLSWMSLEEMITEYREAERGGEEKQQVFFNTRLAEPWDGKGESVDSGEIATEYYGADLPNGILLLTCGVDVQADRLELEVVGWGVDEESWGVQYHVIPGDPHEKLTWQLLDKFLQQTWRRADGTLLSIIGTCIDSGYATQHVYAFTKPRTSRYIYAIKGQGGLAQPAVHPYRRAGKNRNIPLFPLGVDTIKNELHSHLQRREHGAGYCHFPRETEFPDGTPRGYTLDYFNGFTAEKRIKVRQNGVDGHIWVKKYQSARNEPWDCRVYATAALAIRNPDWRAIANTQPDTPQKPTKPRRRNTQINAGYTL